MRKPLSASITLIILLLLFLAFNLVWALKLPNIRLDFSEQKVHTLSAPVQTLLASLERPVDLYFFNSSKHPKKTRTLESYGKRVTLLLKEYEKAAKGKINLHFIDPTPFSEDEYKARLLGLDDQQGFFGLVGTSMGHGPHSIESFSPDRESLLEYEISHLIHKVIHPEQPVIGLISGLPLEGEWDERNGMSTSPWQLGKEIRRQFNLVSLQPGITQIPEHIKTLMVVHPGRLPDQTLYAIDQFVLGAGKLLMFIDPLAGLVTSAAPPENAGQNALLAAWGIQMPANKIIADHDYATSVIMTSGQPPVRHPAALTLPRQAMAQDDISTWKLRSVNVLSSGGLTPVKKSRMTFTPLLQSSGRAALFDAERFALPAQFDVLIEEAATRGQPQVIAARVEGPAYSAFPDGLDGREAHVQKSAYIHVVVVADTDLISDRVAGMLQNVSTTGGAASDNAMFVLNTLDNLAAPDGLMDVRPRAGGGRTLQVLKAMREDAAQAYREKSAERVQRLEQTEKEWQLLNPKTLSPGPQSVTPSALLQALNKERLRVPMEIHALKVQSYAEVHALERKIKLLNILPIPLILCVIAWGVFLARRSRRHLPSTAFY
ncbi:MULTISPECIES: Gldg family protein [unclassified Pseudomonas]|uniref:Gldg family protein n=1 Tax=unclassified Pseudomonas TaxID=196821 RepID=UPI0015A0BDAC|nr:MULTISPECIES: Gldg family protein [unclassified Pseudomonas]NWC95291.1 Gldg family protein [Pseudomonas sp. IPO3779]NWD17109.1 Gldg family protein [Pseudomonas sp. IPO3778]